MAASPIQGFLSSVTIDGNLYDTITGSFTYDRTRAALEKATMTADGAMKTLPGMHAATLTLNGWISPAEWNLVEVTIDKETSVTFEFEATVGLTTDAKWVGNVSITDVSIDVDTDDAWQFTLGGTTDGKILYTPSAP